MSAPPLPDIFGNYVLQDVVEVVAPTAISWLPQTKGWLILGLVLFALLLRYCARRVRLWYSNRYRREAEKRLQDLEQTAVQSKLLSELNRLLKLTAMAAFSREQVARLSGDEWVDFLNSCCPTAPFSGELRQLLVTGTYRGLEPQDTTRQQLFSACNNWVCEHERTEGV